MCSSNPNKQNSGKSVHLLQKKYTGQGFSGYLAICRYSGIEAKMGSIVIDFFATISSLSCSECTPWPSTVPVIFTGWVWVPSGRNSSFTSPWLQHRKIFLGDL